MKIAYTIESETDNASTEGVTIKCSYEEFTVLCEMVAGNVPNGDLETELLSEFEVAQDLFDNAIKNAFLEVTK